MITNITDKERELQAKLKQYEAVMRQAMGALDRTDFTCRAKEAIAAMREVLKDGIVKRAEETYEAAKQRKWVGLTDEHIDPDSRTISVYEIGRAHV